MYFGPLELEACGENNFTIKALGLLAFRPDLRRRFVEFLCPDCKPIDENTDITMLFFSQIGEGFFREAIERAGSDVKLLKLEERLNVALGLPEGFRWARTRNRRLIQPSSWSPSHVQAMLAENGCLGDEDLSAHLGYIQNVVKTEPDIVLQWYNQLAIVEVKVLSKESVYELKRQRDLANLAAALFGWSTHFFYIGPEHGPSPSLKEYEFKTWAEIAAVFEDIPEIKGYVENFAFFYRGTWRSMIAPSVQKPGDTAYDSFMKRQVEEIRPASRLETSDPWNLKHIARGYFESLFAICRSEEAWPVKSVWLGITGRSYADRGGKARPNAMVECEDGSTWVYRGRTLVQGGYNRQRIREHTYGEIVTLLERRVPEG